MAKPQIEIENPMLLERPVYRSPDNVVTIKAEPKCGCGCKDTPNAYNYEGEMFASKDCVIRMMISEGWLKEVS